MSVECGHIVASEQGRAEMDDGIERVGEAVTLLVGGGYTCVACDAAGTVHTSNQRGVRPLLDWLDEGVDLAGGVVADKVVGNGAANLYVLLGVSAVHGMVMSEPARATLERYGITATAGEFVDHIVNRTGDGLCPMECAVEGIDDPCKALSALRVRLAELAGN